jgi:DNA-binding NarL/FixJ family response regulator
VLQQLSDLQLNVILMDVTLSLKNRDGDGIDSIREIRARCPLTQVLLFTPFASLELFRKAAAAGAIGCVVKDISGPDLVSAIRTIHKGKPAISPALARQVVEGLAKGNGLSGTREGLTERELGLLRRVAEGLSDKEVAASLYLSESTVKSRLRTIYQKLKLRNRVQAVAFMVEHDLIKE